MAEFPYLPLWTDAYLADTTHLTTIEHGAYLLLLMAAWRAGGYLPDDDRLLRRVTRLGPKQWDRMRPVMETFWRVENGQWSNGRLLDELTAVRQRLQSLSDTGRANALKRWHRDMPGAMPERCHGNANHTHTHNQIKDTPPIVPPKGDGLEEDFEAFWLLVPRKIGKGQARRAYRTARKKTDAQTLIAGMEAYARQCVGREAQYVCHPSTWLNGERWGDAEPEVNGWRVEDLDF